METGDLQPLQNLNLSAYLNLERCFRLTGQSVSEICAGTTRELIHWLISRDAGSSGGAQPIKIAQCFFHGSYRLVRIRNLCGYNKRHFSFALRFCIGTLEPISGLLQLTKIGLYNCRELTGTLLLFGNNQALTRLAETGDLQPLQNLNLLTTLNLENCSRLTGQSVSEICVGATFLSCDSWKQVIFNHSRI